MPKDYTFRKLILYFLKLGTIGFGGPIALIGYMQNDLVEKSGWITEEEYVRSLALAQLSPGPLAAQLAMCLGFVRAGIAGAAVSGLAFIFPSFVMVVLLGVLYKNYGTLPPIQALFYGIAPAIIGIIVKSIQKLMKVTLKKKPLLWLIFIIMALVTAFTKQEIVWLFILFGVIALLVSIFSSKGMKMLAPPFWLSSIGSFFSYQPDKLAKLFLFFAKSGAFVFGSGLAIVPFLYGGVVERYHWLTNRQFLDAVAVAMITPGPVVITAGFIGFLVSGFWGAILACLGVFLPPYLVVIALLPIFERYRQNPKVIAFVEGITSAATGAIAGAVLILAKQAVTDLPTALIALASLAILFLWKIQEPVLIAAAGMLGLILFHG